MISNLVIYGVFLIPSLKLQLRVLNFHLKMVIQEIEVPVVLGSLNLGKWGFGNESLWNKEVKFWHGVFVFAMAYGMQNLPKL